MSNTKMKGLLKGLRYISQIFDEEKEPEMEIGFPTDVKHVAHIGWDGPSVDSPSWMKEFKSPSAFQSAPLAIPGDPKENPEIKWVSEDGKNARGKNSSAKDQSERPKSSRRQSSKENSSDSPRKEKTRHSRKHHSKDSSDSVKNRQAQDSSGGVAGSESPSRNLPDIPKKSRRKKSKESVNGGSSGSVRSRRKDNTSGSCSSPVSETGNDSGPVKSRKDEIPQTSSSSLKPHIEEEENECSGTF
ncbi:hypothetical protein ACH5RR_010532 [Cinchona calisaya]|uniref:CRIB domain-containing protein n=1 Tax=Cinchona calisaya TaxID=153742 RepID=A0ABD3AJ71_9GENT